MPHLHYTAACSCNDPSRRCVMAAVSSIPPPQSWSSCSSTQLNTFLSSRGSCLYNEPTHTVATPTCGNGIREGDEVCDCGSQEVSNYSHITLKHTCNSLPTSMEGDIQSIDLQLSSDCRSVTIRAVMPGHAEWPLVHSAQRESAAPAHASLNPPTQSVGVQPASVTLLRSALANLRIVQPMYSFRMAQPATTAKPTATLGSARHTMPSVKHTLELVSFQFTTTHLCQA